MDPVCKDIQIKILFSQFDQELLKHIGECESCWESFMNLGLDEKIERDITIEQKKKLLSDAAEPARQGDHRMEQFHLLSSLEMTAYAKRVFLDYLTEVEEEQPKGEKARKRAFSQLEDLVYAKLQKKRQEMSNPSKPIHAELMMSVLDELGEPSSFLQSEATVAQAEPIRKMYRSREDRMIAGVCGGLGEYFRIDPIFIRILFVGLLFVGGGSIPLYILLFFLLPLRKKSQPVFGTNPQMALQEAVEALREDLSKEKLHEVVSSLKEGVEQSQLDLKEAVRALKEGQEPKPRKKRSSVFGLVRSVVIGLFVMGLFLGLYLPLLAVLGGLSIGSALLVFVPVPLQKSGLLAQAVSLEQLGIPGLVAGGSLSLLFFSLFMLLLTFVLRLHFKKRLLGKSFQAFFVVFVVMSIFSTITSAGVIFSRNKSQAQVVQTRSFSLPAAQGTLQLGDPQFGALKESQVFVRSFTIRSQKDAKDLKVKLHLFARGPSVADARSSLNNIKIRWSKDKRVFFPALSKVGKGFQLTYADFTIIVPERMALNLRKAPLCTTIRGTFTKALTIHNRGQLNLEQLKAPRVEVFNQNGEVQIAQLNARLFKLNNTNGKVSGAQLKGTFQIDNTNGKIRLKVSDFDMKRHTLRNHNGRIKLVLPSHNIPQMESLGWRGRLRDRKIRHLSRSKATLAILANTGRIRFGLWYPSASSKALTQGAPLEKAEHKTQAQGAAPKAREDNTPKTPATKTPQAAPKVPQRATGPTAPTSRPAPKRRATSQPTSRRATP